MTLCDGIGTRAQVHAWTREAACLLQATLSSGAARVNFLKGKKKPFLRRTFARGARHCRPSPHGDNAHRSMLFLECLHGPFEAVDGQREHAVREQFFDHAN